MSNIKKALVTVATSDRGGGPNAGGVLPQSSTPAQKCQPLAPPAAAQLERLAERTGLPPHIILNSIIAAADDQLARACVREARRRGLLAGEGIG